MAYPRIAKKKFWFTRHLTQRPRTVNDMPKVMPLRRPQLSRTYTEGKYIRMKISIEKSTIELTTNRLTW